MKTFNITDYGAKFCDRLQTEAIQKAIDDCFLAGGGRVLIPCGIFLTGGLRIRSNVELYLEAGAILKGSRDPEDYFAWTKDTLEPVTMEEIVAGDPKKVRSSVCTSRWCNALIRAIDAHDFAIIGEKGSYIDGSNVYDAEGENNYRGPHGVSVWRCKNMRFEGYSFINSSNWCHAIFQSQNIVVKNVGVYGGHDGVDVRTCDNVLIENCDFNTGDDCVAGFDNHDVIVRNCKINSSCMPFRFGGNNVLFENCHSDKENNFGFRLRLSDEKKIHGHLSDDTVRHEASAAFSYYCDFRADVRKPTEIVIRNCDFTQTKEIIRLEFTGIHRWCCNRSLKKIVFENCRFGELIKTGMLWGDAEEKVTCHFKNVTFAAKKGYEKVPMLAAGNFEAIIFEDCTMEGYEEPTILMGTNDKVEIIRSTPVTLKPSNLEECLIAHPDGLASQDVGKNLSFRPK